MPERDPEAGHSSRLLRGLIWTGVLLAPVAAVVVLLGHGSGSVAFAVLLIAVSVVLVGSSVLIRSDPVLQRGDVEDRVAEEVRTLRAELRAEFARTPAAPAKPAPGFAPPPPARPAAAAAPDGSGFFQDTPMAPGDDPFAAAPPSRRPSPDSGFAGGGRAGIPAPAAAAAPAPARPPGPSGPRPNGFAPNGPGPNGFAPNGPGTQPRPGGPGGPGNSGPNGFRPAAAGPVFGPNGRREPGMSTGDGIEPTGMATGGRPVPAAASIPRQRGAASVPVPPSSPAAPPRASATVRPGSTQYGRPANLDEDFGASNGYADVTPGYPPQPSSGGGTYGSPRADSYDDSGYDDSGYDAPGDGYDPPNDFGSGDYGYGGANGYGPAGEDYSYGPPPTVYGGPPATVYGRPANGPGPSDSDGYDGYDSNGYDSNGYDSNGYDSNGYDSNGYEPDQGYYGPNPTHGELDADGYGLVGGYEGPHTTGDPNYRARRHRPSANDTNVGSLEDFAEYGGWPQPDQRYVQGYNGHR